MATIEIEHFSDVLCVWAYFSEPRLAEVARNFGATVAVTYRFVSVFGDVPGKIAANWAAKGGYDGFAEHALQSAAQFPELRVSAKIWREVRPASSLSPHLYLKAIELCERAGQCPQGSFAKATGGMRHAFFGDGHDVARAEVQQAVGSSAGAPAAAVLPYIEDGRAHAALAADYKAAETLGIAGSPTLVLNHGRQKLYGNVGYRIIEANIQELLRDPKPDDASWC
ncbi:MAG: DsbA family protein [Alphaproteobacteria bacterium]|nr:DsbA family protein [Alphaproteobacteria bacterium]